MTPYDILSVSPDATTDQVERAWKAAIRANHPDHFQGGLRESKSAFVARINAAYDQIRGLRDPAEAPAFTGRPASGAPKAEAPKPCRPHPEHPRTTPAATPRAASPRARAEYRTYAEGFTTAWASGRMHEIQTPEYADLRRNAYHLIARDLGRRLLRSQRFALTLGLSEGRFTLAPLLQLPIFPGAFLPCQILVEKCCINLFCYGAPLVGDAILVPRIDLAEGRPRISRETFHSITYRGWSGAQSYRAGDIRREGLDITDLVAGPDGVFVRVFFLRGYANPTTRAAIATNPVLSFCLNWLYRISS